MRGVIWSCDCAEDGNKRLKYLRNMYVEAGIEIEQEVYSKHGGSFVTFKNGDIWRVKPTHESSRACRSNWGWIDSRVDNLFLRKVILPAISLSPSYYEFYDVEEPSND